MCRCLVRRVRVRGWMGLSSDNCLKSFQKKTDIESLSLGVQLHKAKSMFEILGATRGLADRCSLQCVGR